KFNLNGFWTSLFSALAMTSLDFFIEPVAIQLDFWWWNETSIPLNNYLTWFVASFLFSLFLNTKGVTRTLGSLNVLFFTQVIFFVALFLFL
ncbi:MAG: carotenoid biosynthesis protein, partial [Flavobacteriales bacterium]